MQPWTACWVSKDIPDRGFEVIRDRRHVGIARCDEFDKAVREILDYRYYKDWDRVVCRSGGQEWDVDVDSYRQEPLGIAG